MNTDDETLKNYFDSMDSSGDGELDKSEVKSALQKCGKYGGEVQLEQLFQAADTDRSGKINFQEFKVLMAIPNKEDPMALVRAAGAEFLGVMLFQFFGGLNGTDGAAMNGLILVVLIYCTAAISGGNLNPAVSLGLCVARQIPPLKMVAYWVAQFSGGIIGSAMFKGLSPDKVYGENVYTGGAGQGCTLPCGGALWDTATGDVTCKMNASHIFGLEFLATFVLVFTVFGTAVDPKSGAGNMAPLAIGFSLWGCATGIGSLTGGGLNPARTLAPALVFNCWNQGSFGDTFQWMYVIAQFSAGAVAALVYMYVFLNRPSDGQSAVAAGSFKFMAIETKAVKQRLEQEAKDK